jgi:hypothetical protein
MFREALDVLITGLSSSELSYEGEYYSFKRVRLHIKPFQRPYPRTQHRLSGQWTLGDLLGTLAVVGVLAALVAFFLWLPRSLPLGRCLEGVCKL